MKSEFCHTCVFKCVCTINVWPWLVKFSSNDVHSISANIGKTFCANLLCTPKCTNLLQTVIKLTFVADVSFIGQI